MAKYLMALDQGTTSSRCILFDFNGNIVVSAQKELPNIFPAEGWVEHNPAEIWFTQHLVATQAMDAIGATAEDIAGIGITNQRETTIIWDRKTGKPVYNAVVWQCRRTADYCNALMAQGLAPMIRSKTGLLIDSYFSATKIKWILDNVAGVRERAEAGELMFGTVDCWLIYNLTGGKVHATDCTNAARTMLFNINTMQWDDELLELFNIPKSLMPEVLPSSHIYGYTDESLFGGKIAIAGVAGDQQAALFGQCCFNKGDVKNTYGTGGFMLMNTGDKPIYSENGLLTTVAWSVDGKVNYALEGSAFVCGAAVQWLRDGLGIIENASASYASAMSVKDTDGVYFVPAFVGLGAPYWDPYARGMIIGLTRGTTRNHIVRAVLDAMAFQTTDIIKVMEKEAGVSLNELSVDGGASANDLLLQTQADLLAIPINRPACIETTALGAANLAGLAVGVFKSTDEIAVRRQAGARFVPAIEDSLRDERIRNWKRAVERCKGWADNK